MGVWGRVGVRDGAAGALVTGGLFDLSRNRTFPGQGTLLAGVTLALPSALTVPAVLLVAVAAYPQVRSEERVLASSFAKPHRACAAGMPRWL